tara:strand:- start:222 stop:485 length:264 start_codon:yes stop_codon:yes gene_type:complete
MVSVSIEFSFPVEENDKTTLPPPRVVILLDDDDAVRRLRRPPPPLQRFPVELSTAKESKEETKETPPRFKEEQEGVIVPFLVPTVVV